MTPELPSYTAAFLGGLLSFLSPCVLPLVPIYMGYLTGAGVSNQNISNAQSRLYTLAHGSAFVLGFSLIFIASGAIGGALGDLVKGEWFIRLGGLLVIVMGLHLLGVIKIPLLYMEKRMEYQRTADPNLFSSILIGMAFGAGWTPCVGPILGAILSLTVLQGSSLAGASLLAVYSLGLGIPFLITALAMGQSTKFIRKLGPYLHYVERTSGVLLIVVGLLLVTNQMTFLNSIFIQYTPQWLIDRL